MRSTNKDRVFLIHGKRTPQVIELEINPAITKIGDETDALVNILNGNTMKRGSEEAEQKKEDVCVTPKR